MGGLRRSYLRHCLVILIKTHLFLLSLYLFPSFDHTGSVGQDVNVLVLMVLVDLGPWLEQRLHEQVQEGRHSDLEPREEGNDVKPPPLGGVGQVLTRAGPHQLHRWWVHAAEHLEQNRDVCWVQGPLGQHGAQRLAGSWVGCCCAQSKSDLAGVVTSETRKHQLQHQFTST